MDTTIRMKVHVCTLLLRVTSVNLFKKLVVYTDGETWHLSYSSFLIIGVSISLLITKYVMLSVAGIGVHMCEHCHKNWPVNRFKLLQKNKQTTKLMRIENVACILICTNINNFDQEQTTFFAFSLLWKKTKQNKTTHPFLLEICIFIP